MIPWELLDKAQVPADRAELRLYKRGPAFSIRIGGSELMSSRRHGSEEALADLACAKIAGRTGARVLVGGLGMGYTLAAVLRCLGTKGRVCVAELVPAVVKWNRTHLGVLAGHPLRDQRVTVCETDVADILKSAHKAYDAILMDVDNGPSGLTRKSNNWLYTRAGLKAARGALRPGGVLAVWAAVPDQAFTSRLKQAGFGVEENRVWARGPRGGAKHTIWLAECR